MDPALYQAAEEWAAVFNRLPPSAVGEVISEAAADEYVDERGLYGSPERIEKQWTAWEDSGITGFTVSTDQEEALRLMARLTDRSR